MATATVTRTGPPAKVLAASTSIASPRIASVTIRTIRRSNRSTMIPAGTESSTYGMIRAPPMMPSTTGSSLTR